MGCLCSCHCVEMKEEMENASGDKCTRRERHAWFGKRRGVPTMLTQPGGNTVDD